MAENALVKSSAVGSDAKTVGTVPNNKKVISANKKNLLVGLITYPPVLGTTPSERNSDVSLDSARLMPIACKQLYIVISINYEISRV